MKTSTIHIITCPLGTVGSASVSYYTYYGTPRGEEKGTESLFKVKMAENFSNLGEI